MEALPHLSFFSWVLAITAGMCFGLTKAGFGGFGILGVLLMAQVLPPKESTGAVLPMLIAADLMAIGSFHRHVAWNEFWKLLPTTFLGLMVGWLLMGHIPAANFGHVLGWIILAMMALTLWQRFDRRVLSAITHHPLLSTVSGFIAGVTTMVANAGGAAMSFYLLVRKLDKMAFVGTCAWFFFVTNLVKVPLSWSLGLISIHSLLLNLCLLPAVALGMIAGRLLLGKIPQAPFEWMMILMALASSIRMIFG